MPIFDVPKIHKKEWPALCFVSSSAQLFSADVLRDGIAFNVAAYRTHKVSVQVSQLIMLLYDKFASFRNKVRSTVKTSSQTKKEGILLTSQS